MNHMKKHFSNIIILLTLIVNVGHVMVSITILITNNQSLDLQFKKLFQAIVLISC